MRKKRKKEKKAKKKAKKKLKKEKQKEKKLEKKRKKSEVKRQEMAAALAALKAKEKEAAAGQQEDGKSFRPMTKEEWEKRQSQVRRVYDPETGRNRLVKGDGEIMEEIVSKDRHHEINKQSTTGDGLWYATKMGTAGK